MIENTVKISSPALEVELSPTSPMVISYRSKTGGAVLCGAPEDSTLEITFYDGDCDIYRTSNDNAASLKCSVFQRNGTAVYSCSLLLEDEIIINFDMVFSVADNVLQIRSQLIQELGNYGITSIKMPLVTVFATQPGAKLALTTHSGRLVDITESEPATHIHKVDWFEITPNEMAYNENILGMVSLQCIDNNIISEIADSPKSGRLSVEFNYRHKAEDPELLFMAQDETTCTVTVIERSGDEPVDWTAGAAVVRDTVAQNVSELYTKGFTYKLFLDMPRTELTATFAEALELIKQVNYLTGGIRQNVYLIGWQHEGHDTGYPDVFTLNKKLGSMEDLRAIVEKGRDYNAIVSFHDNYHDIYQDSPAWDPSIVAVNSDGALVKGGIWAYHQAYVIGPAKYAEEAAQRVNRTVEMYPLKTTVHLDVLTDNPDLIDFDPNLPASREDNIYGKYAIISAWNRHGIDVTSEILTSPFVERISHFWSMEHRPKPIWTSEDVIPLAPMMYHGKVTVGGSFINDAGLLENLLFGLAYSTDFNKASDIEHFMDSFYLQNVPWAVLADREMTGYKKIGSAERVIYGPDTYVEVDREKNTYEIIVDGTLIGKDFATMAPIPDGRIAVYSRSGGKVQATLPDPCGEISISTLEGADVPEYTVKINRIEFIAEPRTPYWISC